MEIDGEKVMNYITENEIRYEGENQLDRELTNEELEAISAHITERTAELIVEAITEVVTPDEEPEETAINEAF